MRPGAFGIVALSAILLGAVAQANPITDKVFRAKQVPTTTHVQLTYATDLKAPTTPTSIDRDGSPLTGTWTSLASYTANTGSGLKPLQATQLCDCNVPLGAHTYKMKAEVEMQATITVATTVTPKDAGPHTTDFAPWDIPEPTQIQGLDCAKMCATTPGDKPIARDSAPPKIDAAVKVDAPAPKTDTTPVVTPPKDDGGCAVGGRAAGSALVLLLGLGLLAILLRRR